jgi:type IV pilus assembly protein PilQ
MKYVLTIILSMVFVLANAAHKTTHVHQTEKKEEANLSFNFKDIPIRDLLGLLAQYKQMNLILSESVQGELTLHLDHVTWHQALDSVLNMQGLGMRQEGNILLIAPGAEMVEREQQRIAGEALHSAFIELHYAKAADLSAILQNKTDSLLSTRGSVTVDERTNQLWITDTADRLLQIHHFLKGVDIPAKQVQIGARIVNVDTSSVQELGLKFGTTTSRAGVSGVVDQLEMDMPLTIENVGHFTIAIAKLGEGNLLDLEISALEKEGKARTVSSPQLITANRQPAVIESGQEIPYQEKTSSGATNVSFKKAVLSLKVTPEITPENKILLTVTVNQDKVDKLQVNGVPAINTQQVQSQILLNDGETIILGGIYEQNNSNVVERIPFWGSIPGLGKLFSNKESQVEHKELLVFVTPKTIK